MSTEPGQVRARSSSPEAERMRLYRKRRQEGMRYVRIPLHVMEVDALIRIGDLKEDSRTVSSCSHHGGDRQCLAGMVVTGSAWPADCGALAEATAAICQWGKHQMPSKDQMPSKTRGHLTGLRASDGARTQGKKQ